jgi:hypothetical protein
MYISQAFDRQPQQRPSSVAKISSSAVRQMVAKRSLVQIYQGRELVRKVVRAGIP